jgi:protein-S-isoprenylcysteine O-methyltransferase Ste14
VTSNDSESKVGLWRQLRAIGPLPGMVAIAVPTLLVYLYGAAPGWGLPTPAWVLPPLLGAALIVPGIRLWHETVSLFAEVGEGTLAPWDPTRRLVVLGPYRRVRNPMISGVGFVLLGEAAALGSLPVLTEFAIFAVVNATHIPLVEEPGLVRRFGDDYREYRRAVPRWIPRRKPWTPRS